jgi:hypothetical protein
MCGRTTYNIEPGGGEKKTNVAKVEAPFYSLEF